MTFSERFRYFKVIAAIGSLFFFGSCINSTEDAQVGSKMQLGDKLPNFSVVTSTGQTVSNITLQGKVGVVVFFYTPCKDCIVAMPIINQVYEKLQHNEAISWICISRAEGEAAVSAYWAENNFALPYSAQSNRMVYDLFAYTSIPRIYISNAQGIISAMYDDSAPINGDELERVILELVQPE